jgi:hypothetical protein
MHRHGELYGVEFVILGDVDVEPWIAGVSVIVIGAVVFVLLAWITKKGKGGGE